MQLFPFLHPHSRWSGRLHAFVDGELHPDAAGRFEGHAAECADCAFAIADARNLKQALRALPELEAPRSFRLTPAMITPRREPAKLVAVPAPRKWTPAIRFAQVTAALAVLGLVAAGTADLTAGSTSRDSTARTAAPVAEAGMAQDLAGATTVPAKGASAPARAATTAAAVAPAASGNGGGAAGGIPTAPATETGSDSYSESAAPQPAAPPDSGPPASGFASTITSTTDGGPPARLVFDQQAGSGSNDRNLHGVELLLAGLLAASLSAWLFLRTKGNNG